MDDADQRIDFAKNKVKVTQKTHFAVVFFLVDPVVGRTTKVQFLAELHIKIFMALRNAKPLSKFWVQIRSGLPSGVFQLKQPKKGVCFEFVVSSFDVADRLASVF